MFLSSGRSLNVSYKIVRKTRGEHKGYTYVSGRVLSREEIERNMYTDKCDFCMEKI